MSGSDCDTRRRLVDAGARLFGARGFKKVTVRELCREARANVAAVNYHFRDKAGLYREVLERAIAVMRETTAATQRAGQGGSARERLRAYIRVYLRQLLAEGGESWVHRLLNRELADPTPALDAIVNQAIRPREEYVCALVGELIGRPASDAIVRRAAASIQAQCTMALPHPIRDRLRPRSAYTPAEIDALARHIAEFSLAGIRAVGRKRRARA